MILSATVRPKLVDTLLETKRAVEIAKNAFAITSLVKEDLIKEDVYKLYQDIELPLSYVLFKMEKAGIVCDGAVLDAIGEDTLKRLEEAKNKIFALAKREFNLNSPKQLAEVLFDEMGLPSNKKRSTSAEYLLMIKDYSPIIDELLTYRKFAKLYRSIHRQQFRFFRGGRAAFCPPPASLSPAQTPQRCGFPPRDPSHL